MRLKLAAGVSTTGKRIAQKRPRKVPVRARLIPRRLSVSILAMAALIAPLVFSGVARAGTGQITEFSIPTERSSPHSITAGPEGDLWFTETGGGKIGRITPSGQIAEFPLPAGSHPFGIAMGADGNLWFTGDARISRMTPSGEVTEFPLPASESPSVLTGPITAGPNGNLWFTMKGMIGRITTGGQITEFPLPSSQTEPAGIAGGPGGSLWFTEPNGEVQDLPNLGGKAMIGRITTTGQVSQLPVPTEHGWPWGIAAGSEGDMWFTESGGSKIGQVAPDGQIKEFHLSSLAGGPEGIAAGPDGDIWFTERSEDRIGRITPQGQVTEIPTPGGSTLPAEIALGSDGNLWFTEMGVGDIGRITSNPLAVEIITTRALVHHGWVKLTLSCEGPTGDTCTGRLLLHSVSQPLDETLPWSGHSKQYILPVQKERQIAVHLSNSGFMQRANRPLSLLATATTLGGDKSSSELVLHR